MQFAHPLIQILARDVSGDLEEDLEDRFALLGMLELVIIEVAGERAVLDIVRHRTDGNRRTRQGQMGRAIRDHGPRGSPRSRLRLWRAAGLWASRRTGGPDAARRV